MGSCCCKKNSLAVPINAAAVDGSISNRVPRWKKGALIGEGAYGKVYECLNLETGELHAVKHIQLSGTPEQIYREVYHLKKEIIMLKNLYHKNIIQYLYTDINAECNGVDIMMEYVSGGSMRRLLNKFGKFEETMAAVYISQVLEGLKYLHEEGIIHRDIKSANILVTQDGVIKLSDFGASKKLKSDFIYEKDEICKSLKGSPYWMAPEVARRTGHTFSADIWSVGCVMIEMLTGKAPWSSVSRSVKEILQLIISGRTPPIPKNISAECTTFIEACLQENYLNRPSASDLLKHRFIIKTRLNTDNNHCIRTKSKDLNN
jgi:mitogen-activated protein kinase kinase kinase ANP1